MTTKSKKTTGAAARGMLGLCEISPELLAGHPLNRAFPTQGPEWEDFVDSVRAAGRVRVPLHARRVPGGTYQLLAGHRRACAARALGLETVPVLVEDEMDDVAALAFLVNENLQRLDLSPVDEARLCAAMRDEMALSEQEIAARVSRSVGWVRTRQLMLELGDEVLAAVASDDADHHLSLATVDEVLRVPECWRGEAVQMVLHPEFEVRPLGPEAAREVLRVCLIEPKQAEAAWNGAKAELVAEWRKRLKGYLTKEEAAGLLVVAAEWQARAQAQRGTAAAEARVPDEMKTDTAPAELTWLRLAVRHGLAVRIGPGVGQEETQAVVDVALLRTAEAARAEYDEDAWLSGVEPGKKDARTQAALAVLSGEGDPVYQDGEEPEEVIEQTMEHRAWIDMGAVRRLRDWADAGLSAGYTWGLQLEAAAPEVPEWAQECRLAETVAVCAWVETLKG